MAMDQDTANRIAALCTRAAMIMEDNVDNMLTMSHVDQVERTARLQQLRRACDHIVSLVDAALALDA